MNKGNTLIFSRYSREECGLPPVYNAMQARRRLLLKAIVLVAALICAGWLAGKAVARTRLLWLARLPRMLAAESDEGRRAELLSRGRLYAVALNGNDDAVDLLMASLLTAGYGARRPAGYYATVAAVAKNRARAGDEKGERTFEIGMMSAHAFGEIADYRSALDCLARAGDALEKMPDGEGKRSHSLLLANAKAYYLAQAPGRSESDAARALELASIVVSSRDKTEDGAYPSSSAAFLDTLAAAYYAVGRVDEAVRTQKLALGLAAGDDLTPYLENYDRFADGAR